MKYFFVGDKHQLRLYREIDKVLIEEEIIYANNPCDIQGHKDVVGTLVCPHSRIYDIGRSEGLVRNIERCIGVSHITLTADTIIDIKERGLRAVFGLEKRGGLDGEVAESYVNDEGNRVITKFNLKGFSL